MPTKLNRDAYQKLIDEDIAWVEKNERTLERDHVIEVLRWSVGQLYPKPFRAEPTPEEFPVLWQGGHKYEQRLAELGCPRRVPWKFIADHHEWCRVNHDQSPRKLAERGGLSPEEMVAVVRHIKLHKMPKMTADEEVAQLFELLRQYHEAQKAQRVVEVERTPEGMMFTCGQAAITMENAQFTKDQWDALAVLFRLPQETLVVFQEAGQVLYERQPKYV
jgi:hypothetical protein